MRNKIILPLFLIVFALLNGCGPIAGGGSTGPQRMQERRCVSPAR